MPIKDSQTIPESFDVLRSRIKDPEFRAGHGLGNEVPFFVLPYEASKEAEMRGQLAGLLADAKAKSLGARVFHADLWETFCQICEGRRITPEKMSALEQRRGSESLLARMQKIATPEAFVAQMRANYAAELGEPQAGQDVLVISGVGKVYPLVRAHNILENAQPVFTSVPVVLLYPGSYDGQELHLFNSIHDGNYYRAFSLI